MERPVLPPARELGEGPPQDARPPRALRGVGYQAGEVTGGLEALLPDCVTLGVFGITCRCLGLERLIRVKPAAGRPKDLEAIAELEAILEERGRPEP
ncbi:MAG: hypothetical protein HYV62_15180 [Candidatus Rokubacteria bacterium]|nr:hypothetical protein [Candidatus Rokubacteria bacterium]